MLPSIKMVEINDKVNNGIPLSQSDAEYLLAEIKRLHESVHTAQSESFRLQREMWRKL